LPKQRRRGKRRSKDTTDDKRELMRRKFIRRVGQKHAWKHTSRSPFAQLEEVDVDQLESAQ
jgi:hypothetical protein